MKRKKLIILMASALVVSVLALSGCSQNDPPAQSTGPEPSGSVQSGEPTQSPDLLAQIQERGEIVVAMEGT